MCVFCAKSEFNVDRAFHHYSQTKDHKKLPELERLLKEEYRSLNDFKVHRAKIKATAAKNDSDSK